jgi:hypothetical protein
VLYGDQESTNGRCVVTIALEIAGLQEYADFSTQQWEERLRKRLKAALPQPQRSPSPPVLPHLRSPSPPLTSPYPQLTFEHSNYSSLIMDPSVQHSFRSQMLNDISRAINNLIEGEATMKRAAGRLWQAVYSMRTDDGPSSGPSDDGTRSHVQPSPHPNGDIFGGYKTHSGQENGDGRSIVMEDVEKPILDGRPSRDAQPNDNLSSDEVPSPQKLPPFLSPVLMTAIK